MAEGGSPDTTRRHRNKPYGYAENATTLRKKHHHRVLRDAQSGSTVRANAESRTEQRTHGRVLLVLGTLLARLADDTIPWPKARYALLPSLCSGSVVDNSLNNLPRLKLFEGTSVCIAGL